MLICGYDDCPNETFKSGLCEKHHMAWGSNDPQVLAYFRARPGGRRSGSMCKCGEKAKLRGFCQNCYQKHKTRMPKTTPCAVEGCEGKAAVKKLCLPHYNRARVYGSPTAAKPFFSPVRRDFTGIKFGKITVVSGNVDGTWNCKCDCGTQDIIKTHSKLRDAVNSGADSYCSNCTSNRTDAIVRASLVKRMMNGYRAGAFQRKLAYELSLEDIEKIIFSPCSYCGNEKDKEHSKINFCGIDRCDNTIGYIPGNVVPCCTTCNFAKRDLSQSDWETWLDRIVSFRKL